MITDLTKKKYQNFKSIVGCAILGYYILLVGAIFYFTWNVMEQYTFILSIIPCAISILYLLATEKTINPMKYLNVQQENYIKKTYDEFDFDMDKLTENEEAINKLKAEIVEIKKASR